MEYPEHLTISMMEKCTYRYLQQVAKFMGLPSNVKKVNLIEMIHAKKYCTAEDLDCIIVRIKEERKQHSQNRKPKKRGKKVVQDTEISTSNQSPPISRTPRRTSGFTISNSRVTEYHQPNILRSNISKRAIESDRVLRSSNNRTRTNYNIFNISDSVINVVKQHNAQQRSQDLQDRQYQLNMAFQHRKPVNIGDFILSRQKPMEFSDCAVQTQRRDVSEYMDGGESQLVPAIRSSNISQQRSPKRQRRLSEIYALLPPERTSYYQHFPSVGFRQQDGRLSKINALVQKPIERNPLKTITRNTTAVSTERTHANPVLTIERRNILPKLRAFVKVQDVMKERPHMVTVQEVINYKIDQHNFNNPSTESARDGSGERKRENIVQEYINRNTEARNCATEDVLRYTESVNFATENAYKYTETAIRNAENANGCTESKGYTTKKTNRCTDSENYADENLNTYTENGGFSAENLNRYTETRGYATENLYGYTENRDYTTELPNRYTENRDYITESTSYAAEVVNSPESRTYVAENTNSVDNIWNTEARNVVTDYPNMSALTDILCPENQVTEQSSFKEINPFSVYYHKKIRAEQVKSERPSFRMPSQAAEKLPRITDAFSQFKDIQYRNLTQPLYAVAERAAASSYPISNIALEKIYNFKSELLPIRKFDPNHSSDPVFFNVPLDPVPTTNNTQCVFSTTIRTSAFVHPSTAVSNECNTHSYGRAEEPHHVESESMPRLFDYLKMAEQEQKDFKCEEVLASSSSSFESNASSVLEDNVTIPELVEDAMELISQDGDYMERIGMDVRMQCVLCDWAGPSIILEYHIRKEHAAHMEAAAGAEWRCAFPLGAARARAGVRVLRRARAGALLLLRAGRARAGRFAASLAVLPTEPEEVPKRCRLTVYNKVTGEPHAWEGDIAVLSDSMPHHTDSEGLKVDISTLDLLPNSANLKLTNGELAANSTAKVVVGQPDLDSIEIVVHVKVFE